MNSCGVCLPGFTGVHGNYNEPCLIPLSEGRTAKEVVELDFSHWYTGTEEQKNAFVETLRDILTTGSGFFYLKNHGVGQTLIENMFADMKSFFGQPK